MRINKFVAASSNLSRRAADAAIIAGRVKIGNEVAALGQTIGPDETVSLDDHPLTRATDHTYLMLNKPTGYVSSRARQGSDPTLYEILPKQFANLRIAGRLDRDSSGLILLSDDGDFIQAITHPSSGKTKEYELTLSAPLTAEHHRQIAAGISLSDGPSRITVRSSKGRHIVVTLEEGRNRQLRRSFGALGLGVERLHRTRMGEYELANVASGTWQLFDPTRSQP